MATQRYRSVWVVTLLCSVFLSVLMLWGYSSSRATVGATPKLDRDKTILRGGKKELVIVGENFETGMFVQVETKRGVLAKGQIEFVDSNTVLFKGLGKQDFPDGVATITLRNPSGVEVTEKLAVIPSAIGPSPLTVQDIQQIISQGVSAAIKLGFAGTFTVMDREGNILAIYQMKGAPKTVVVQDVGRVGQGLEGLGGPVFPGVVPATAATISKAGVGAFFATFGNAFTTRTAAYIIREHIPPFIRNMPGGPLFGVQVSSLGCSDVKQPGLPLGLAGDTGGIPIYKNGIPSGGIGVELNGEYSVALNRPGDFAIKKVDPSSDLYVKEGVEEMVAFAAQRGFEPPDSITADKILVNGIRLPYRLNFDIPVGQSIAFNQLPGSLLPIPETGKAEIRTGVPTEFRDIKLRDKAVRVVNRFFPFKNGKTLTASDAEQMLFQATTEAYRVRAAIRRPIEVFAEVNISVIDANGTILGIVSTPDAPIFGFDVAVEKGRSAVFFSRPDTAQLLTAAGLPQYANRLKAEGLPLDGSFIMACRSVGWISRPFYPDGIQDRQELGAGPLASQPADFSPLNNGFQTDYLLQGGRGDVFKTVIGRSIVNVLTGKRGSKPFCDATTTPDNPTGGKAGDLLNNTLMIFSGSSPVFKNGALAGAVGISGDGIDQDDIIGSYGSENFEVPAERRIDRFFMRGIRIPFTKFPRHPHLGEE